MSKKKYVVIEKFTAGLKTGESLTVGDEVELTDKQAAARVNKVKLLADKPSLATKAESTPVKSVRKSSRAE